MAKKRGIATSVNVLSAIKIPLGDSEAVEMNFAETEPASIGGFVYRDDNNDGNRQSGELGIHGIRVRLVPIATVSSQEALFATTDASGAYQFDGLSPGSYEIIEVDQPQDLIDGLDSAGTIDGNVVGIADEPGDAIRNIGLFGGDVGIEYNFGELALGKISGLVYLADPGLDCSGTHPPQSFEALGGVIVELQRPDGNVVSRITTTPMGEYRFSDIPPGVYRIVQYTPGDLLDGSAHVGTIDGQHSGQATDGTMIRQITMTPGGTGIEYDFCEVAPANLSGNVYYDHSNDGQRDTGEQGIANTRVSLIDSSGTVVQQTTTDADGKYEFHGLMPGTYELREDQPIGYIDGIDSVGRV